MSTTIPLGSPHSGQVSTRDDGPGRTPDGRRYGIGFWLVAAAFLSIVAFSAVPTPLYRLYAARDGFGPLMITVVFAVYVIGLVGGLQGAGHISDWYGRRRVLMAALATAAVSGVVFLFWRDLPGLIVARLINGLAIGVTGATATAWLTELHKAHRPAASSRGVEVVSTAANLIGVGAGAVIAGMLAQWVSSNAVKFAARVGASPFTAL